MLGKSLFIWGLAIAAPVSAPVSATTVYGLVGNDRIVTFHAATPETITSNLAIAGLALGEVLTGIDIRPLDGQIYTVGTSGNVYHLQHNGIGYSAILTGVVTTFPFPGVVVPITGHNFGIDFAPADRIRLVSDLDQNLRINPLNGGAAVDPAINDGAGGNPYDLIGVAFADGAEPGAPFYAIDGVSSSLLLGTIGGIYGNMNLIGETFEPLGLGLSSLSDVGFDILFHHGVNRAFLAADDSFYRVDLETGRATLVGGIGIADIRGIATMADVPEPATWGLMITGFGIVGFAMRKRRGHAQA